MSTNDFAEVGSLQHELRKREIAPSPAPYRRGATGLRPATHGMSWRRSSNRCCLNEPA